MNINDLDFLISEKDFEPLKKELKKHNISFDHSKKWHTMQISRNDLKIEMDSKDFWQKDLPNEFEEFNIHGFKCSGVSLNTLKNIYKKASEVSQDNPKGNLKKYKLLKDIK